MPGWVLANNYLEKKFPEYNDTTTQLEYHGNVALKVITRVQQYQVECYGNITSRGNFQSTKIQQLRLIAMEPLLH